MSNSNAQSSDYIAQARMTMLTGQTPRMIKHKVAPQIGSQLRSSFRTAFAAGVAQGKANAAASQQKNKMPKSKAIRSYMWGMLGALLGTLITGGVGFIILGPLMLFLTIVLVYRLTAY